MNCHPRQHTLSLRYIRIRPLACCHSVLSEVKTALNCAVLFVVLGAVFSGCEGDTERIVEEKVAERVSDFRKRETERCYRGLLAEAERIVDSSLLAEAMYQVLDSLRQLHPPKPVKPPILPPWDTSPVRPIFDTLRY